MNRTLEAADTFGAETIIIQAWRAARKEFHGFLDGYAEPASALRTSRRSFAAAPF